MTAPDKRQAAADLVYALGEIVFDLSEFDPMVSYPYDLCVFCGSGPTPATHLPSCVWRRAVEITPPKETP